MERLRHIRSLELPPDLGQSIRQNRLLQLAREGAATTPSTWPALTILAVTEHSSLSCSKQAPH